MNRIRSYRVLEGATQDEVADLLGVARATVSAVEKGTRALNVSLAPLGYSDERSELPMMSAPLHRHRASTLVSARDRAKELLRLSGEVFSELVGMTPQAPKPAIRPLPAATSDLEVEDAALDARFMLGVEESGPIKNLTTAIEMAGICVVPIRGLKGIDGISAWVGDGPTQTPVIGLDPDVPGDRFRFSLGHELGHLVMHRKGGVECEAQANRFSGSLLFPHDEFLAAMPGNPMLKDFIRLKEVWGVSVASLVYRARQYELIDDRRYRALQIQMSKWRRQEPGQFDAAPGQLFPTLVNAYGGHGEVAKKLGVNERHLREITTWAHLRIV